MQEIEDHKDSKLLASEKNQNDEAKAWISQGEADQEQQNQDTTDGEDNPEGAPIKEKLSERTSSIIVENIPNSGKIRNQVVIFIIALSLGFAILPYLSMNKFFSDVLHLDPAQLSLFNSIINFVWILKPVFGFITDSYPICGSHRKSYIILASLVQFTAWILLGYWVSNLWQVILIKTLINFCTNFQNVIGEAIMVEASQKQESKEEEEAEISKENRERSGSISSNVTSLAKYDNKAATTNVSIYLSLTAASSLVSSYLGAKLLDYLSPQQMFMLTSTFSLLALSAGFILYEVKRPIEMSSLSQVQDSRVKIGLCARAKKNWLRLWQFLKLPFIFKPMIFIFLVVLAPGVEDPFYYFNSNVLHFTNDQFSYISLISSLSTIIGIWTYRYLFRNVPFKKMIIFTTTGFAIAQASKLLISQQLTYKIGLSPVVYSCIVQFFYTFVNELHLMPLMVLACKMSPKAVEASFYALILAVINLGYLVSYQLGGLLTYLLGITATNFDNLWILIVIASAFPLVTLFFLVMIPSNFDVNLYSIWLQLSVQNQNIKNENGKSMKRQRSTSNNRRNLVLQTPTLTFQQALQESEVTLEMNQATINRH